MTNIVATLEKSEADSKPETFNLLKDLRQTASKLSKDWKDAAAGSSASPKVSEKEFSRIKDQLRRLYSGLAMVAQKNSVVQDALRKVYNKWISSYNWPKTSPEVITLQGLLGENLVNESRKKKKKKKAKGPVNKPRRIRKGEPGYGKKKFVVLAKQGSKTKTIKYGDANLEIKRDNPKRRKSFNARHKCKTAKDKLSARYWSCRQWRAGKKVEESLKESHMNNFPYFDYYGGSGKIHDEYRPEEHWMMPDVADNDLNAGVTVDVDLFAEKLAGAIADVFEEMFGNSFNSEISHEQLTYCVESALFEKRF